MKNSKILRVLLIIALLLACGSSGVLAGAEMVTKDELDNFDRTLKRDYQASFFARCYNYTVTDRNGNILISVTPGKNVWNGTYTFDDDKLLFVHRNYTGTRLKYPDFIYLYDTDYYAIEPKENGAFLIEYPNERTSYVINAVDGMKIVCDDYTVTLSAPTKTTVNVELHTYTDNGSYNMYFDIPIDENGNTFSFVNKIFEHEGIPGNIWVRTPSIRGYIHSETPTSIDLVHDFLILYRTSKAAEKPDGVSQAFNVTFSWNKIPKAKRYIICKKTEDGFVKIGKVKETNYLTTISQDTLFKVKAQRKVKGRWKTIKTSTVVAKME